MKTRILTTIGGSVLLVTAASAQSAYDAYSLVPNQLRGTARFVAMGGAFTSLGADLSVMTQNPAGLALYRSSDIGLTFDISPRSYHATTNMGKYTDKATPVTFDNVGYAGVSNLSGNIFKSVQWGVSYNRIANYDRVTAGYVKPAGSSLSDYVASYTQGVNSADLMPVENEYDPYFDSDQDWLSILAYDSFMINNNGSATSYTGLYQNGTFGDALFKQRERGYVDEYNIDFATNISDVVFVGMGVGIYDLSKTIEANYSESMEGALVPDGERLTTGNAGFNLHNYQHIDGSGANFKFGVVVRPIETLRIGAAIHTPTYLHLRHSGYGDVNFNYTPQNTTATKSGDAWTPDYDYRSRLTTPWRFMVGASVVIGPKAILSVDYERQAYNDMRLKQETASYDYGYGYIGGEFTDNKYANQDIKNIFRASDIVRIGAEYRALSYLTIRAGYNWQSKAVKNEAYNGGTEIYTSGTNPAYSFDGDTQSISFGLGFRYKAWYADITYQHVHQDGTYRAYTPTPTINITPSAKLSRDYNNIVISTGIRF